MQVMVIVFTTVAVERVSLVYISSSLVLCGGAVTESKRAGVDFARDFDRCAEGSRVELSNEQAGVS